MTDSFRTPIDIKQVSPLWLTHSCPILTVGSCFANEVGKKLAESLFDISVNPFGPLFNPVSICNALTESIKGEPFDVNDLILDGEGRWCSYSRHSSFSSIDKDATLNNINRSIEATNKILNEKNLLVILTFGSTRVFVKDGVVVANCHKLPQKEFSSHNLTLEEAILQVETVIEKIFSFNPTARFILTVSPVRHKAYGLHEDKLSKAVLLLATDRICKRFNNVYYFPAYEIMMDDLRDYRFYNADMVHPSETAVEYIYQRFMDMFMPLSEKDLITVCRDFTKRKNHRQFTHHSVASIKFIDRTKEIEKELSEISPSIDKAIRRMWP